MIRRKAKKHIKKEPEIILEKPKTLIEILKILYNKSSGRINGETKTFKHFQKEIKEVFALESTIPISIGLELTIKGRPIYCTLTKYTWGYDYYIPDTRKDEERLKKETGYYDT